MSKGTMKYNEICSHPNIRSSVVFAPILRVSFCCTHLLNRLHSVRKNVNVGTCLNLRNVRNVRLKRTGGTGSRTKPSWGNAIRSRGPDPSWLMLPWGMWNDCDSCCQTFLWPLKCKRFKCFSMTWRIYYIEYIEYVWNILEHAIFGGFKPYAVLVWPSMYFSQWLPCRNCQDCRRSRTFILKAVSRTRILWLHLCFVSEKRPRFGGPGLLWLTFLNNSGRTGRHRPGRIHCALQLSLRLG